MSDELPISAIKELLSACHEAKRITELQPPLPQGMTPANLKVLDTLKQLSCEQKNVKVSDISELLQVTRPGITRLVRELEELGAVVKLQDERDKRIVLLRLTALGERLYSYYIEQFHGWLAAGLRDVRKKDIRTTAKTIARLYAMLSTQQPQLKGPLPQLNTEEGQRHE